MANTTQTLSVPPAEASTFGWNVEGIFPLGANGEMSCGKHGTLQQNGTEPLAAWACGQWAVYDNATDAPVNNNTLAEGPYPAKKKKTLHPLKCGSKGEISAGSPYFKISDAWSCGQWQAQKKLKYPVNEASTQTYVSKKKAIFFMSLLVGILQL